MKQALNRNSAAFALLLATLVSSPARAQSTAFTYQGVLDDGGVPASGPHDLIFRLYSVASGGSPIGSPVCIDNVSVVEGVFVVQLDFGQQFATTAERHLGIEVRVDTGLDCANGAGFVVMAPRQRITAAPMANHAKSAFSLSASDGIPLDAVLVDDAGNVGVGIPVPVGRLHVKGNGNTSPTTGAPIAKFTRGDGDNFIAIFGDIGGNYIVADDPTNNQKALRLQTRNNKDILLEPNGTGKVGIGTSTPSVPLHVSHDFPVLVLQDSGPTFSQSGYVGFWNSSGTETAWAGYGTPGSPHFTVFNARAGGNIALRPGVGGVVTVPVIQITGADLAERFPCSDETVEPGTVMEIDPRDAGKLRIARGAYNRRVAGVVSGANGFAAGAILGNLPGNENTPPIALSGRVYVMCDATKDPIQPGDLLTTSDTPGHAMKAADHVKSHGAILGKAMTGLESGHGTVLVLVSLQ